MSYNLSELFERVADTVPDREAVVVGDRRVTYASLDERATRLANHLRGLGVGPGDHVGLQLQNGPEYLEGMLAAFKLRAVPVNVNYRYVARELADLFDNADLVALVVHRRFASAAAAAATGVPGLAHLLVVEDGSGADLPDGAGDYDAALAAAPTQRDFPGRSGDDVYCAYTGGTTGMPKGVLWRHEDIFFVSMGGGDPTTLEGPITDPDQLPGRVTEAPTVYGITAPLMHVSAHWGAFQGLFGGGTIVLPRPGSFDPEEIWRLVTDERLNVLTLVGDAMARPLIDAYDPARHDASTLFVLASGGAMLTAPTKERIRAALPNVIIVDGYGSTETGVAGSKAELPGGGEATGARFTMDDTTTVLDDELQPVAPGSGVIGRLARRGRIPLGYYNDEAATAATFVERDGVRWALPGDMASVDADGTIVLHGRGSVSINTGGEKVFPEEVETALVAHPGVRDAVVVGMADERWGQRVVAVVAARPGAELDLDGIQAHCRAHLAGYKVPRELVVVPEVERSPSGKADYRWARAVADAALA